VRRIEAVTGPAAYAELKKGTDELERVADQLKATPEQVETKVGSLLKELEARDKEIARLRRESAKRQADNVDDLIKQVDGVKVLAHIVEAPNTDLLREQSDYFKTKI